MIQSTTSNKQSHNQKINKQQNLYKFLFYTLDCGLSSSP